jgi:UDP-galactopyranose mutase
MIYTGPIDHYFDYCYGKLPYRSIDFAFQTFETEKFQLTGTINYPNDQPYTRVTEFKYLTGQQHPKTTVVFEYPKAEGDPYYPVPRKENAELYKKYRLLTKELPNVFFTGRLATYKYYNMDQVVAQSLTLFKQIVSANQIDRHVSAETKQLSSGNLGRH